MHAQMSMPTQAARFAVCRRREIETGKFRRRTRGIDRTARQMYATPRKAHAMTGLWRDDLDASGPTINLRRDRSVWIMFLLIASCNS
jgi:hypothetical protein